MRQVWSPPPSSATTAAAMRSSPGGRRPRLSAISFTPDPDEDTPARLLSSDGDRDFVEGRQAGRTPVSAVRVSNGRVTAADDHTRRQEDDATVQALLRELGVDPTSVSK